MYIHGQTIERQRENHNSKQNHYTNQPANKPTNPFSHNISLHSQFFKQPGHHRKRTVCSTERHIFSMSDDKEKCFLKHHTVLCNYKIKSHIAIAGLPQ